MKKLLLAILILMGVHSVSKAQLSITPHVSPAFPSGTFGNFAGTGFGYGLEGTYAINDNLSIGAAIDRYQFGAEILGFNIGNIKFNVTPITGTIRYFLPVEVIRPFVGFEAGVYNFSVNQAAIPDRTYFGLAPTAGVLYPINDRLDFFANAKYQTLFINENINLLVRDLSIKQNIHFIPINVGLSFKFDQ